MIEDVVYLLMSLQIFHHHVTSGCDFDDTAETGGRGGGGHHFQICRMTGLMTPCND